MKNRFFQYYMIVIGLSGQMVFYLQFIKIIMDKSAENVSLPGFVCGLIASCSWFIYGMKIKDPVLVFCNFFAVIGALLATTAIVIFS